MAAYIIADLVITDPEGFRAYQQRVGATLAPYGGVAIVRGGAHETMEGEWHPQTLVFLQLAAPLMAGHLSGCLLLREIVQLSPRGVLPSWFIPN